MVNLAQALNLKVVAEGVETDEQFQILRQLGCDEVQGFLFAKPMSAKALGLWAMADDGPRSIQFSESLFKETRRWRSERRGRPALTACRQPRASQCERAGARHAAAGQAGVEQIAAGRRLPVEHLAGAEHARQRAAASARRPAPRSARRRRC